MKSRVPSTQRTVDRTCKRIWNEAGKGRCFMQGIKTARGGPPAYCGPNSSLKAHKNHTISESIITAVDYSGTGKVVAFLPPTEIKKWSRQFFVDPIYPATPIGEATVGRYACEYHDNLFNVIDEVRNYENSNTVATLLALRATLLPYYVAHRNDLYFTKRAKEIPDETREQRMSGSDYEAAERARNLVTSLSKEIYYIVGCLKDGRPTKIQTDSFELNGAPTIGGTMVWGAHIGHPVTCTIVPVPHGHRVHVTYRRTLFNSVQRAAADLLSNRTSETLKREILSEIALEHHQTIFILRHKWHSFTINQQESVRRLVKAVDVQTTERSRWLGRRLLRLHGNPDVPDLFA